MTKFYKVNENKNPHFESLNNSSCANGIREHSREEGKTDHLLTTRLINIST